MRIATVLCALLVFAPAVPARAQSDVTSIAPFRAEAPGAAIRLGGQAYQRGGPVVFFDANTMVRTGSLDGTPVYADTTLEPYSVVFVPLGRGLMQPYERVRGEGLAGTSGSRTPSFPAPLTGRPALPMAAMAPTALSFATFEDLAPAAGTGVDHIRPGTATGTLASPALAPAAVPLALPVPPATGPLRLSARVPAGNDGIWITHAGRRWVSTGVAVVSTLEFSQVGTVGTVPVFAREALSEPLVYLPTLRAGLLASYRRAD